jgi:RNA-directed DNA polymerase
MHLSHNFTSETELKKKLDFIYGQSRKGKNFHGIVEVAFNEVTIITAIHNIKSNKGAKTAGIDKAKIDKYLQIEKDKLIRLIKNTVKHYQPRPVRREYIPKRNGKLRPLGIPTILDRIIQECLRIVIEPIAEGKFYPHSYGFRPFRATKHAVRAITTVINARSKEKPIIAIEGDIKGYFDNIDHRTLLKKLWKIGVHDKRVIAIIKEMLKAGYIEGDCFNDTEAGTVQGGIISPLFANIYLNDFDWTIGRMYHQPRSHCKYLFTARTRLRGQGVKPKYLIRYADDWIILTTTTEEASRLLKYLNKYFRHRLKLELSSEKTIITNLKDKPAKFLSFILRAELPRNTPENPNRSNIVGKQFPDMSKVKAKVKLICQEIKSIKCQEGQYKKAVQIEKVNSMLIGLAEYYKSAICRSAFRYIDNTINRSAFAAFKSMYGKSYKDYNVTLAQLANRPGRHKGYNTKTFAIKANGMWVGITKAFLTHSQWEKYSFNQNVTPYSEQGRELYLLQSKQKKAYPLDRPALYDIQTLNGSTENVPHNFEYYMNREYAYNRDRGKCKICKGTLTEFNRHCHYISEKLSLDKINKVPNLAWMCTTCDGYIHEGETPKTFDRKTIEKIRKYQRKLRQ